ncbi:MAG: hypothetical protein WAM97_07130 [Acidimicrobiales bacterium]
MFRTRLSRALLVPAVLVPVSLGSLAFAANASAAAKPAAAAAAVKCTSLSGTVGGTGTVTGCKGTGSTGGSGSFPASPASSATITWANGQTTTASFNYASGSGTDCPSGGSEYVITGTVSSSTTKTIPKGQKLKGDVCLNGVSLSLYPGTKFKV